MKSNNKLVIFADLRESKSNPESSIIENVIILSQISDNNRIYTDECQQNAVPLFENMKSFTNHTVNNSRNINDLIGKFINVSFDTETHKTKGDLKLIPNTETTSKLINIAETMPDIIGISIHASAKYYYDNKNNIDVVSAIIEAYSGDVVINPATTKGLFEEKTTEVRQMDIKDITLEFIRENKPSILFTLDQEIIALKESNKTLTVSADNFKSKITIQEKKDFITKQLKESSIGDITETFMSVLLNSDKTKIKDIIEDRKILIKTKDVTHNHERNPENNQIDSDLLSAVKG